MSVSTSRREGARLGVALSRLTVAVSVAGAMALTPLLAAAQGGLPKTINIGTNPSGSLFYSLTSGIAATIATHAPFKAEAAPYSGTSTFLPLLNAGQELDFGVVNAVDMGMAYLGPKKRKIGGKNPFTRSPNVRLVVRGGAMSVGMYVRQSSNFHVVSDLRGHKVSGKYPAQQAVWYNGFGTLSSCGMTWKDVDVVPVPAVNQGFDALKDGRVEASFHAVGSAKVREVDAAIHVRMLRLCDSKAGQERVEKAVPGYFVSFYKAGSSPGITQDASAVSYDVYLATHKSMSNKVVYDVVKALWNGQKTLFSKHPVLRRWKRSRFASAKVTIPYHPGAIQFFKEKGIWTHAMEENQEKLLKEGM